MRIISRRLLYRFYRNQDGSQAIEAAVAVPVFLIFIIGIMSVCHALLIKHSMFYGLDFAGRMAMVSPATSNTTLENTALGRMAGVNADNITVTASDSSAGGIDYKILSASYTYTYAQYLGLSAVTLTSNITVPIN